MIKPHIIQLWAKPKQSAQWIKNYTAVNYRHKLVAKGGFESMSATLQMSANEGEAFIEQYIGNIVRVYVDNPVEPIWEGFITRITLRAGGAVFTRSTDNMMNRVNVTYYNADSALAQKTEQTAVVNNTASQNLYGIKEGSIDAGVHYNNADKTHKTTLRNTLLGIRAYPQISVQAGGSSSDSLIEIECQGLVYFAYEWQNYKSAVTTLRQPNGIMNRLGAGGVGVIYPENLPFVATLTDRGITANASFNISEESKTGQTFWQFIKSVGEAGDGTQQWVWGLTSVDPNLGYRYFYYKPATTTINYTTQIYRDSGYVRDVYGNIVNGWEVKPDYGIRINDAFIGWNLTGTGAGDDPRVGYIETIEYDGETGAVTWQTGDNITLEGVFQNDRYFKAQGSRFGATIRPLV
jgi:hypothetical protein